SAAQLAIARDYGFPSWPRLKAAVDRRRAQAGGQAQADGDGDGRAQARRDGQAAEAPPPPVKSWEDTRAWPARLLLSSTGWVVHRLLARTGEDVQACNRRVADAGLTDEPALRSWLAEQGITGYAQALLAWERFGYPDFLTAHADELIDAQYADRPRLRPVLDAVLAALPALGPVTVQARKTLVSLVGPRRTFAVVQATTKNRVDLGLRLDNEKPG